MSHDCILDQEVLCADHADPLAIIAVAGHVQDVDVAVRRAARARTQVDAVPPALRQRETVDLDVAAASQRQDMPPFGTLVVRPGVVDAVHPEGGAIPYQRDILEFGKGEERVSGSLERALLCLDDDALLENNLLVAHQGDAVHNPRCAHVVHPQPRHAGLDRRLQGFRRIHRIKAPGRCPGLLDCPRPHLRAGHPCHDTRQQGSASGFR